MTTPTVLVTGATGYVGYFVVKELLSRGGYNVRGTVRNLEGPAVEPLKKLEGQERLTLVQMDLLDEDSVKAAMEGVTYVQHVASPFKLRVEDAMKDLVTPAVQGTTNVLKAAAEAKVTKVCVTSSIAAILDRGVPSKDEVWDETYWNETATLDSSPYPYSKVCAEKEAWKLAKDLGLDLVVLNPTLVLGPIHNKDRLSESFSSINSLIRGRFPVVPNLSLDIVDVRDVAIAHAEAMVRKEATGERIMLVQPKIVPFKELCAMLKKDFPLYASKVPTRDFTGKFGTAFVSALVSIAPKTIKRYVRSSLGRKNKWNVERSTSKLGMEYRDGMTTLHDTVASLIEHGALEQYKVEPKKK